ncbi:hypothetical protein FRUB_04666 [Fimbriiglobus ruber]|uniref:Uncharacterized protein n=1 Tax=Fimbriiglobus ruber TaxID=1908690 RepID=A0A225DMC3_9BACT|nr:hypothetical protein FRUB_04666 [Fimbriiglobus ruber]
MDRVSSTGIDMHARAGAGFCAVVRSVRPRDSFTGDWGRRRITS